MPNKQLKRYKAETLAKATKQWVWVVKGVPSYDLFGYYNPSGAYLVEAFVWEKYPDLDWYKGVSDLNPLEFPPPDTEGGRVWRWTSGWRDPSTPLNYPSLYHYDETAYRSAIDAARAARFEHGEQP